MQFSEIKECRICRSNDLRLIYDLGNFYSCGYFLKTNSADDAAIAPLSMIRCDHCGLVQLKHNYDQNYLFRNTYGYRSGLNNSMSLHLTSIVEGILEKVPLSKGDYVLDIGSNDGTLLKAYPDLGLHTVGIDPSIDQFREYYPAGIETSADFFTADSFFQISKNKPARVVTSISMFYDLPDPNIFVADIAKILQTEGLWIFEQSYLPTMLERNSFDTICHEHLEYYGLTQIVYLLKQHQLRVVDVEFNDINGGSFRVYACHEKASFHSKPGKIEEILKQEENILGIQTNVATFKDFWSRIETIRQNLLDFLVKCKALGQKVHGYGASTKGNTLLQYFGIDSNLIEMIADCNATKWGSYTPGSFIPITSEEESRQKKPDYYMVLPWHFRENFLIREKRFLENGGSFVFPLPEFEIVENKTTLPKVNKSITPTAVIVGSNGQDGYYLSKHLITKGYDIFGLNKDSAYKNSSNKISSVNILDKKQVATFLTEVKPSEIYYLAAYHRSTETTESKDTYDEFQSSFSTNVLGLHNFLDGIEKYSPTSRLFYAGSSHVFGDPAQIPQTENTPFQPICSYGITKTTGIELCRFYRKTKNVFASTGILYNHESPRRNAQFVTRKIIQTAVKIKLGISDSLTLGDLNAKVDWGAAMDYVVAMHKILAIQTPDDFVIATGELHTIREFVDITFSILELDSKKYLREDPSLIRKTKTAQLVGDPTKLKINTGWLPSYSFKALLEHMVKAELALIGSLIEEEVS